MANVLNFNKTKKQYMTVVLPDEKETTIMIGTPTKKVMDEFIAMGQGLQDAASDTEAMDELYDLTAKIMSHNKGGIRITSDQIAEILDLEDIMAFIQSYTVFIQGITGSKN